MKRIFSWGMAMILPAIGLMGQTADNYVNEGVVNCPPDIPPQIDAFNFINHGFFSINFTNLSSALYSTASTLNFTNTGTISGDPGFEFANVPASSGRTRMAANFYNAGVINAGSSNNLSIGAGSGLFTSLPKLLISATNVINPGTNNMGFESILRIRGQNVDLSRGTITVQNSGTTLVAAGLFFNNGIFDNYWGASTNAGGDLLDPSMFEAVPASTPFHIITNRDYRVSVQQWDNVNGLSYLAEEIDASGSNRTVQAAFVINTNADLTAKVFFPGFPDIAVEWSSVFTNSLGMTTNFLYLFDYFGVLTNFDCAVNGFSGSTFGSATYKPENFQLFSRSQVIDLGTPAIAGPIPMGTFIPGVISNQYTAYEALFTPASVVLSDVANQDVTNLPGRVEIAGEKVLNLSRARITSGNYLELNGTNHFAGSSRAIITSPFSVINLRSTNGLLSVTNLMGPALPRPEGLIDLYAARWTNFVGGITNTYHVLFVNTMLAPLTPTRVQDLILRTAPAGGNDSILLSDIMHVTRSMTLETARLTITTNEPGSPTPIGGLIISDPRPTWSTATPRLQYLTNYGIIQAANSIFFGGSRGSPFYSSNFNEPYIAFVNAGTVTDNGSLIWAKTFVNSGTFMSLNGDIQLQLAHTAVLTNGVFLAPNGNIGVAGDSLLVSNHLFQAGGALTLSLANTLDDGSLSTSVDVITNRNFWTVKGFNLLSSPARGSLLATTVTNLNTTYADIINTWAGQDYGASPDGFAQNSAVGRLILDGRDPDSLFTFTGTGISNAIYVDSLEFRNSIETNRDAAGNFTGVQINPNMKIYYGQALANGISIAEKLSGKNGGGFIWVSNFNTGFFSSTNVIYPDGTTNRLNTALVLSCDIDSDGDGVVNCLDPDPIPIFRGSSLAMSVTLTEVPKPRALVSWNSVPFSTNFLYASSSALMTNCQVVTNFVLGPIGGRVTVVDAVKTNGPQFYRARVDPPQH